MSSPSSHGHGTTEDGRAEDGQRTTDGITDRSALEARSLDGAGAVVPQADQRFLHTARSLHGDGAVVAPVLSGAYFLCMLYFINS